MLVSVLGLPRMRRMLSGLHQRNAPPAPRNAATLFNAVPPAESAGRKRLTLIKTGDRSYCLIGEWDSIQSIIAARPKMIARLDRFRDMLEDLGRGLGRHRSGIGRSGRRNVATVLGLHRGNGLSIDRSS